MAAAIPAAPRKAALYYLALILAGLRPDHGGPLSGQASRLDRTPGPLAALTGADVRIGRAGLLSG